MKCDKCKEMIDEREGYITLRTEISATFSQRNTQGQLENHPAHKESTKEIICLRKENHV